MTTKLFDLTAVHVTREMHRSESDPLADPRFQRHVVDATTEDQRKAQSERMLFARARRAA